MLVINQKAAKKTTKVAAPVLHAEVRAAFEAGAAVQCRLTGSQHEWSAPKLKKDGTSFGWLHFYDYRVVPDYRVYQRRVEEITPTSPTASGPYPTWYNDGEPNIELRFIGGKLHSVRKI